MQHVYYVDELMFLRKPHLRDFFISNFFSWASQNTAWSRVAKFLVLTVSSKAEISDSPGPGSPGFTHHRKGGPRAVTLLGECGEPTARPGGCQQQVQDHNQNPVSWVASRIPQLAESPCLYLITLLSTENQQLNTSLNQKRFPAEPAFWELRTNISLVSCFEKCGPWTCSTWELVGNPESQPPWPAESESAF